MTKLDGLVDLLSKAGVWWTVFQNSRVQDVISKYWLKNRSGMIKSVDIDRRRKSIKYGINEICCGTSSPTPHNCLGVGVLCGQAEALFGGFWDGKLSKCGHRGDSNCEFEIYLKGDEDKPVIQPLPKEEYSKVIDNLVNSAVIRECSYPRKRLGDSFHIGILQCINFLLVSLSPGHSILSKYSGRIIGERITGKAEIEDLAEVLSYLKELFLYWKVGILKNRTEKGRIVIGMDESVFASGVSNINMKLCIFLAGIIEGALTQATGERWNVDETKCIADGDGCCEFRCKVS